MENRTRRRLARLAIVLIVVGLLYFVVRGIDVRKVWEHVRGANVYFLGIAVVLQVSALLLWAKRWQVLIPRAERPGYFALLPIYLAGFFGNVVTPGARLGGEAVRAWYMSRRFGGEKTRHLGTVLVDKAGAASIFIVLVYIATVLVVTVVNIPWGARIALLIPVLLIPAAITSGVLLREKIRLGRFVTSRVLPAIYHGRLMEFVRRKFPTYNHFQEYMIAKLDNVFDPIRRAVTSPKALTKIVLLGLGGWIATILSEWSLFLALGVFPNELSLLEVFIIICMANVVGDLSITPGGAGFMETAMIYLCAAFGVTPEKAAAVTLISRAIFYLVAGGGGGACVLGMSLLYGRRNETDEDTSAPETLSPETQSDTEQDAPPDTIGQ
jgi:glycosyltransferase 2 family protein